MVLSPGSLKQGDTGFQRVSRVFVDPVNPFRPGNRQAVYGTVKVFHDLLHHETSAVARTVERLFVGVGDDVVIERNIPVLADLLVVEDRSEEIGYSVIFLAHVLVCALHGMFQIVVDGSEVRPGACAPGLSLCLTCTPLDRAQGQMELKVVVLKGSVKGIVRFRQHCVESVRRKRELFLVGVERLRRKGCLRELVKEPFTGCESQRRQQSRHKNIVCSLHDHIHLECYVNSE